MINFIASNDILSWGLIVGMGITFVIVMLNADDVEEVKVEEVKLYKEIKFQK